MEGSRRGERYIMSGGVTTSSYPKSDYLLEERKERDGAPEPGWSQKGGSTRSNLSGFSLLGLGFRACPL